MQPSSIAILKMLSFLAILTLAVAIYFLAWGSHDFPQPRVWDMPEGDPERGRQAILRYGCGSCHVIPGIRSARGRVGPQLIDLRNQIYLAGVLPNTPENLVQWIQHPRQINPRTAMPELGVSQNEAEHIGAYLYRE